MNSEYVTVKHTAAERTMWRYSRGISRTCCTAEEWSKEGRSATAIKAWQDLRKVVDWVCDSWVCYCSCTWCQLSR